MKLARELKNPLSFEEAGVNKEEFFKHLHQLAVDAYDDQCSGANPRFPLVNELEEVLTKAYYKSD